MKNHLLILLVIFFLFAFCKNRNHNNNCNSNTIDMPQTFDSVLFCESDLYNYLKFEKQIIVDSLSIFTPECQYIDDSYYFFDFNKQATREIKKGDYISLFKYSNGKTSSINLILDTNSWVHNVLVTDSFYVLLCYQKLLVYDKGCNIVKSINTEMSWDFGIWDNDTAYLFNKFYGISASKVKEPTTAIINFKTMSIENIHKFKVPKGAALTHMQPKVVLGLTNEGYFLSDITKYRIEFYDFSFKRKEVIEIKHHNWRRNDSICNIIENYKDFNTFKNQFNSYDKISYIEKVQLINDSTLFVTWIKYDTIDNSERSTIDIWKRKSSKWKLYKKELNSYFNSSQISNNTISYDFIPFYYNTITLHNNLVTRSDFPLPIYNYIGRKYYQYFLENENYNIDGSRKTSLLFYKFKE